jgi:hypothetical protein
VGRARLPAESQAGFPESGNFECAAGYNGRGEGVVGIGRNEPMQSGGSAMRNRFAVLIVVLLGVSSAWSPRSSAQTPPVPAQELPAGTEVLNRGPVNEAFAEPAAMDDQAGLVVPKEPPASIEEVPPADRPTGDNYVWIPGYWSWDADRNDFVWVGACWRVAPPNMHWVPGYWAPVPDGWKWVAGFWAPDTAREIEYLPAPPSVVDVEASGPPPDPDDIWVPGCWYWARNHYISRPGYWLPGRPDWVWVPSHYSWSPRGYIFVAGYWDYGFGQRGVMFAPIYFPPSVYGRPGFSYCPDVVIDLDAITLSLFAYPRYGHFFFGDYYDDSYVSMGIYPRFDCDRLHTWYDPIFEHDRWHHRRTDPRWDEHQRVEYDRHRRDRDSRPPRTYHQFQAHMGDTPGTQRGGTEFVRPFQTLVSGVTTRGRFVRMNPDERQRITRSGFDVARYREERSSWEATGRQPGAVRPVGHGAYGATPWSRDRGQAPPRDVRRPDGFGRPSGPADPDRRGERVSRPERVRVPQSPISAPDRGRSGRSGRDGQASPPPTPRGEHGRGRR